MREAAHWNAFAQLFPAKVVHQNRHHGLEREPVQRIAWLDLPRLRVDYAGRVPVGLTAWMRRLLGNLRWAIGHLGEYV